MVIWSFAQRWRFPDLFPTRLSERFWSNEWQGIIPTVLDSLSIAIISSTIALILALVGHEYRIRHRVHVPVHYCDSDVSASALYIIWAPDYYAAFFIGRILFLGLLGACILRIPIRISVVRRSLAQLRQSLNPSRAQLGEIPVPSMVVG